jgi:hypothetical protein
MGSRTSCLKGGRELDKVSENVTPSGDDQREFFASIEQSILLAAEGLLSPFDQALEACQAGQDLDEREFYVSFLVHANQFAQDCCACSATAIRRATLIDEVRGTTAKALAIQMRDECFEALDRTALAAFQGLAECDADLSSAMTAFANTDVVSQTITSALVGGVIGGVFKSRGTGAFIGGIAGLQSAVHGQLSAAAQALEARKRGLRVSREKTEEYVRLAADLPLLMIDFIGAKCFGGRVNLAIQESCISSTASTLKEGLERAGRTCGDISSVLGNRRQRREAENSNAVKRREAKRALKNPVGYAGAFIVGGLFALALAIMTDLSPEMAWVLFPVFGIVGCFARYQQLKAQIRYLEGDKRPSIWRKPD